MRNTRHMTYNTRHVQLNSHKQKALTSRFATRQEAAETCNMQHATCNLHPRQHETVWGSFHRGLPLTCRVNPFDCGRKTPVRPVTPRDATRRHETPRDDATRCHETTRRDATRRNETPQDAPRRLRDASRLNFDADVRVFSVILI